MKPVKVEKFTVVLQYVISIDIQWAICIFYPFRTVLQSALNVKNKHTYIQKKKAICLLTPAFMEPYDDLRRAFLN